MFLLMLKLFAAGCLCLSASAYGILLPERNATCILNSTTVKGIVSFNQKGPNSPVTISFNVSGLSPNGKHGIHVHEFGDLSNGCASPGGHFNPQGVDHGNLNSDVRHAGDLGNLIADGEGVSKRKIQGKVLSLFDENSVLGRGMVVHAKEDDLGLGGDSGSKANGNSGTRIACCVIGLAKQFKDLPNIPITEVIDNHADHIHIEEGTPDQDQDNNIFKTLSFRFSYRPLFFRPFSSQPTLIRANSPDEPLQLKRIGN